MKNHKYEPGSRLKVVASTEQLKGIGILFSSKDIVDKVFTFNHYFVPFDNEEPCYEIDSTTIINYSLPENFLQPV